MSKGISNFQIENAIDKIGDEDLNDNFVGVFPSNYSNKLTALLIYGLCQSQSGPARATQNHSEPARANQSQDRANETVI